MYGYATRIYVIPEESIGVVVVANLDAVNPVVDRIAAFALDLLLAERSGEALPAAPKPATNAVDSLTARPVYSRYEGDISLIERNGRLFIVKSAERFEVFNTGSGFITDNRLGYGYKFEVIGDSLIAEDGVFVRRSQMTPAAVPQHWDELIGEYGWDHNVLYIYEDQGRLYALIEWFFRYPLEELSPDIYRFPSTGLYIDETLTFRRNVEGMATRIRWKALYSSGVEILQTPTDVFQITPLPPPQ